MIGTMTGNAAAATPARSVPAGVPTPGSLPAAGSLRATRSLPGTGAFPAAGIFRAIGLFTAAILAAASPTAAGQAPEEAAPVRSARERLVRVVALEDARSFGDGWLFDRVFDPDHEVRRQAALALGRIGRPEAVAPLLQILAADEAGAVRAAAAFALGIVEDPLPEEAVAALESALADPSGLVREKAVEALGRRGGPRAGEVVGAFLRERLGVSGYAGRREDVEASMRRTGWDEERFALFSLARIADDGNYGNGGNAGNEGAPGAAYAEAAAALLGADGVPRTGWWVSAWTVARLGLRIGSEAGPALGPLAAAYAAADDPVVRALGVRGLGALSAPGAEAAARLVAQLQHPNEGVRLEATRALLRRLEDGRPAPAGAGEALLRQVADPLPAVRREALRGLAAVRADGAAEALLEQLGSGDRESRARALRAYHRQDPDGFFLLLSGWSDRDPLARGLLARELAAVPDPRLREFLGEMAREDGDPRARAAALTGLGTLEATIASEDGDRAAGRPDPGPAPETLALLRAGLGGETGDERAAAAGALRRLAPILPRAETAPLAAALEDAYAADDAAEPDFRLAALRALVELAPERDRLRFAERALADPAWPVRREAHAFLRRAGSPPDEPPAPADPLPDADYDAMLHPRYTPVAWITTDRGEIELELFIADAPRTVWNFMRLARERFFDGLPFHRAVPNFVLEAGASPADDPDDHDDQDGPDGPGAALRSEINERSFMRGSVGLATDGKDTGGSRFFLTLLPQPHLNGRYPLFAQVRRGFEALDRLQPGDRIRRVRIWDGVIPPE